MKSTAKTQASFSLPVVFLEKRIEINGISQTNAMIAKIKSAVAAESSILFSIYSINRLSRCGTSLKSVDFS